MRLLLMVENGGEWNGKRILSRELAEQMHTNSCRRVSIGFSFGDEKRTGVGLRVGIFGDGRTRRKKLRTITKESSAGAGRRVLIIGCRRTIGWSL